jgi:hypothetical protein
MAKPDTIGPYDRGFREFTEAYEAFGFADIHKPVMPFLPSTPGLVLDVGAGSGRVGTRAKHRASSFSGCSSQFRVKILRCRS